MKALQIFTLASFIAVNSYAQPDSTRRFSRGDDNASINATTRSNVPKAQRNQPVQSRYRPSDPLSGSDKPDVLLDIPNVSVDEITLDVQNLQAHLALDARVANLVKLTAGVDVSVDKVNITIKGVQATALLIVRLDNVRAILDRTLTTLDNNPQIIDRLMQTVDNTVGTVGDVANTALQPNGVISQTVNTLGQTVTHTVDATGNILEKTLDNTGRVLSSNNIGKVLDLPVVKQTTNAAGQTVKQVKDASGALIDVTLDSAGNVIGSKVVSGGAQQGQDSRKKK